RRLRDTARRARFFAFRRPAPARRDRARDPGQPSGTRPRRCDLGRRCDEGTRDPLGAANSDGRPHDPRDRAPAGDDRARRPCGRSRRRPDRRGRDARPPPPYLAELPRTARTGGSRVMERASTGAVWREVKTLLRPVRRKYLLAGLAVVASTLI